MYFFSVVYFKRQDYNIHWATTMGYDQGGYNRQGTF